MLSDELEPLLMCRLGDERLGTSNMFMEAMRCECHFRRYWTAFQATCRYQPLPRENAVLETIVQIVNVFVNLFGA